MPGAGARRLLALLAVEDRPVSRALAAERLWPNASRARAQANLRSTIWRLQRCCPRAVEIGPAELRLTPAAMTDIRVARGIIDCLLDRSRMMTPAQLSLAIRANLRDELLPNWYDEGWLHPERERFRQLRIHALEILSQCLVKVGWHGAAIDAALAAVHGDPFREAAHAALVSAHLADGNYREARRHVESFRAQLLKELGVEPSHEFIALLSTFPACCGLRVPQTATSA